MAKIVSTKFGDRRLVYLPPINLKRNKTPNVETIETTRQVPDRPRNMDAAQIVPKEYAYNKLPDDRRNAWLGAPVRSTMEGNIVTEYPNAMGEQIFQQLHQQAGTNSMMNYSQGQYPVLPPIGGNSQQMQYTNYGLQNMSQQQPPSHDQAAQPGKEKHIYYGPDGEVLPGPPQHLHNRGYREILQDFAFEGLLHFGRLRTITLIESGSGFPKMPDYLIKELIEKYGQYEQTVVKVVCRLGKCYVHATPLIQETPRFQSSVKPKYVPVYLNEDEDFDYDKFISDYENGFTRSPYYYGGYNFRRRQLWSPPTSRNLVYRMHALRPNTYDNAENFRWRKTDDRIIGRRTAPSRAEVSEYRFRKGRELETRDDIKPIEKLDRYYRR